LSDANSLPKIPGFEIAFQIGRGAMGSVYRARQIKTGQLVAIKILSSDLSERADLVARFEREAYALKSLSNPNIVSVIDAGHADHLHYFAMEFIDGITLRTRINRGPISIEEACFITSQMLNGLKEAHMHGIIHRDLKPENVLLAYDDRDFQKPPNRVVLVDFGLVGIGGLQFDPHPNLTRSRVTMGTVNYMAPEQHVDAKRVDHRSDLYSAGVIFYEMLTKELPLGRYLLPFERGMAVPARVDEILSIALSRNLEARYSSAKEFQDDVRVVMNECRAQTGAQISLPSLREQEGIYKLKYHLFRFRYGLLLMVAGLFFALGIKFSRAESQDFLGEDPIGCHASVA
jgi:serine/threonine-protein kinase